MHTSLCFPWLGWPDRAAATSVRLVRLVRLLRLFHLGFLCGLLPCIQATAVQRDPSDRPNVVLIFLDDCGYGDFQHTGNPTIRTPEITRLSREGVQLTQFYSASPACTASRYSLLTGRYPPRSGLGTWVLDKKSPRHIHTREITLAEGFKERGYATALFGKWHLGSPNEENKFTTNALPLAHGFDAFFGTTLSNDGEGSLLLQGPSEVHQPVAGYELLSENVKPDAEVQSTLTATSTRRALEFIKEKQDQPFFLYLPYHMPHLPVYPSPAFKGTSLRGTLGDVIEEIDHSIGLIRQSIEKAGLIRHTLFIVTSDNGPWIRFHRETKHPYYGDSRLDVGHAGPFKDGKGSTWEGGVRVPAVLSWPGKFRAGHVEYQPASMLDLLPTLFAIAGVERPHDRTIDGRDIRACLLEPGTQLGLPPVPPTIPPFKFLYTGQGNNRPMAVRDGPWKLHIAIHSQTGDNYGHTNVSRTSPLLFQVEHDLTERVNQAPEHPNRVTHLLSTLDSLTESFRLEGSFWTDTSQ